MPVVPNSYVCAEKSEKRAWRSQAALRAHGLARSLLIDCPVACANNRPSARSDHTGWDQWRKAATSQVNCVAGASSTLIRGSLQE